MNVIFLNQNANNYIFFCVKMMNNLVNKYKVILLVNIFFLEGGPYG